MQGQLVVFDTYTKAVDLMGRVRGVDYVLVIPPDKTGRVHVLCRSRQVADTASEKLPKSTKHDWQNLGYYLVEAVCTNEDAARFLGFRLAARRKVEV